MTIRSFVIAIFVCSLTATAQDKASPDVVSARAQKIHDSALVIDTHADTPQRFLDEGFDIGSTDPKDIGHISLNKAHRGNRARNFFPSGLNRKRTKAVTRATRLTLLIQFMNRRRAIPTAW